MEVGIKTSMRENLAFGFDEEKTSKIITEMGGRNSKD